MNTKIFIFALSIFIGPTAAELPTTPALTNTYIQEVVARFNPKEIEALSHQIEQLWDRKEHTNYFHASTVFYKGFDQNSHHLTNTSNYALIQKEVEKLLSKKCNDLRIITWESRTKESALRILLQNRKLALGKDHHLINLQLLIRNLHDLRREFVPDYQSKRVYMNVSPPISSTNTTYPEQLLFPGMDPDVIQDPVVKEAYLKAIDQNYAYSLQNERQDDLRYLMSNMKEMLAEYLIELHSQKILTPEEIDQAFRKEGYSLDHVAGYLNFFPNYFSPKSSQ